MLEGPVIPEEGGSLLLQVTTDFLTADKCTLAPRHRSKLVQEVNMDAFFVSNASFIRTVNVTIFDIMCKQHFRSALNLILDGKKNVDGTTCKRGFKVVAKLL